MLAGKGFEDDFCFGYNFIFLTVQNCIIYVNYELIEGIYSLKPVLFYLRITFKIKQYVVYFNIYVMSYT